jgi:F0F1-type ATP synthase assembly protein I
VLQLSPNTDHGVDLPLAVAIQFVVAVVVWGGVGFALDRIVPVAPWLQFAGIMLGALIGLALVQRRAVAPDVDGGHGD